MIWTVKAHNGSVQGLAVSTSGLIATASSAGNARVWSPEGHLLADLPIRPDDVPSVAFASGTNTLYFEDGNESCASSRSTPPHRSGSLDLWSPGRSRPTSAPATSPTALPYGPSMTEGTVRTHLVKRRGDGPRPRASAIRAADGRASCRALAVRRITGEVASPKTAVGRPRWRTLRVQEIARACDTEACNSI